MTTQPIWEEAFGRLRARVSPQNFDMWLAPIELMSFDGSIVRLRAPNSYVRLWFEANFLDSLRKEMSELGHEIRVEFGPDLEERPSLPRIEAPLFASGTQPHSEPVVEAAPSAASSNPVIPRQASVHAASPDDIVAPEAASLNPRYTFDTFVAGPSNQLAFAASQ